MNYGERRGEFCDLHEIFMIICVADDLKCKAQDKACNATLQLTIRKAY